MFGVGVCLDGVDAIGRPAELASVVPTCRQGLSPLRWVAGEVGLVMDDRGGLAGSQGEPSGERQDDEDRPHQRWLALFTPIAGGGAP